MTSHNASDDDVPLSVNGFPLLWLPYVAIVLVFVVFLAVNFGLYHRKVRERYTRKKEELAMRKGVYAKRRIISLMRADFHPGQPEDKAACAVGAEVPREATPPALFLMPSSSGRLPGLSVSLAKPSPLGDDEIDIDAMKLSAEVQPRHGRRPKKKRRGHGKFKGSTAADSESAPEAVGSGPQGAMRWRDGVDGEIPKKKRSRIFGGNIVMSSMMNSLQSSQTSRSGSD